MALFLMVYTVVDYELWQSLKRRNITLPNQFKEECNQPDNALGI